MDKKIEKKIENIYFYITMKRELKKIKDQLAIKKELKEIKKLIKENENHRK